LLLLLVVGAVVAALGDLPFSSLVSSWLLALLLLGGSWLLALLLLVSDYSTLPPSLASRD
jgi:hypothetical protein